MDDRQRQERIEGALTFARIRQLEEKPVQGQFDVGHLREIHRRIFQDLPHHSPGEFRPDAPAHLKARALESGDRYDVHYAPGKAVDMGLVQVLDEVNGPSGLRDVAPDWFADRMARLYVDLDYLHPFKEGNSRTLRSFTRQLAYEAGYMLHWGTTNANGITRDKLYMARDREVLERAFPGLDERRAMTTNSREEYEAYFTLQGLRKSDPLKAIVPNSTYYPEHLRNAKLFLEGDSRIALKEEPRLAGAFGLLTVIEKQAQESGLDAKQREIVVSRAAQHLAEMIRSGQYPDAKIREADALHQLSKDR